MKVLHICETVKAGTATYLNELVPLQECEEDMQVKLLMPREHAVQVPDIDASALVLFRRRSRALGLPFLFLATIVTLFQFRPDIVHAHSTFAGVVGRLVGYLCRAKVIYSPHGWAMDREQPDFLRRLYARLELGLSKLTTHFVAVSEHEVQRGIQLGIQAEKITKIYNGLRESVPAFFPVVWNDSRIKILFVGRLDKDKGVDILLEACRLLTKEAVLHVIGGAVVEKQSFSVDDYPHVTFYGWMSAESIPSHMASCDVVVVPSRWEGFGYVAAEAMKLSKPVFAANVGGLKELIEDGETGFLFPAEDATALAKLIKGADRGRLQKMGQAGRIRFQEKFTSERMAREVRSVYKKVMR